MYLMYLESCPFPVIFQYNLYTPSSFFLRGGGGVGVVGESSLNRVITGYVIRRRLCITSIITLNNMTTLGITSVFRVADSIDEKNITLEKGFN